MVTSVSLFHLPGNAQALSSPALVPTEKKGKSSNESFFTSWYGRRCEEQCSPKNLKKNRDALTTGSAILDYSLKLRYLVPGALPEPNFVSLEERPEKDPQQRDNGETPRLPKVRSVFLPGGCISRGFSREQNMHVRLCAHRHHHR